SIQGIVLDGDGQPIVGARVEIESHERLATSGADGSYVLAPVWPGEVTLAAAAPGSLPRGLDVSLDQGQTLTGVDFTLLPVWDFEIADEGLSTSSGWAWGSDAVAGAHSGSSVWGTFLGDDYGNCGGYQLDLPPFSLRPYTTASLQLWTWYNTEEGYDGGNLQVSIDGGESWTVVTP
ncbi:MAG: carboxypeptidase regulatory-like domain-containing protein, partial [bacterium]|nr:carboxypeptidase regulatory-like domain-containing protein [bacterium]